MIELALKTTWGRQGVCGGGGDVNVEWGESCQMVGLGDEGGR